MSNIQNLNGLLLAWHGVDGDNRIFRARVEGFNGTPPTRWSPNHADGASCAAPALDNSGQLDTIEASIGLTSPSAITLKKLNAAGAGAGPSVPPSFTSTTRPAIASQAGHLTLAWRRPDGALAWASQSGAGWTPAQVAGRTSHGPALATDNTRRVMAWKVDNGAQINGSVAGGGEQPMRASQGAIQTSDAPALCGAGNGFVMAWKGVPGDERIWWSRSADGLNWETPREAMPQDGGIRTIAAPAIAVWRFGYVLVWRGVSGDQRLWWSRLSFNSAGGRWATPQVVDAADSSNSSPSLASYSIATL